MDARKAVSLLRRVKEVKSSLDVAWSDYELHTLVRRLAYASEKETIDDHDLRVIVRIYNREVIGRSRNGKDTSDNG